VSEQLSREKRKERPMAKGGKAFGTKIANRAKVKSNVTYVKVFKAVKSEKDSVRFKTEIVGVTDENRSEIMK
jgi:hypothetical protein